MYRTSETDVAKIEKLPGNVFNVTVKKGAEIDLVAAQRLIGATNSLLEAETPYRGGIYDLSQITYIQSEARNYLAEGNDVKGKVTGVAIISSSFLGEMIGNLFITLGSPRKFPVKYFDSPIRAELWVREQMKKAKELDVANANNDIRQVA